MPYPVYVPSPQYDHTFYPGTSGVGPTFAFLPSSLFPKTQGSARGSPVGLQRGVQLTEER